MNAPRKHKIKANTPYEGATTVVLYEDTYDNHIPDDRKPDGIANTIITCLEQPTRVVQGTTNQAYVIFVNENERTQRSNSPFAVVVDPAGQPFPAVASFSYRTNVLDPKKFILLWQPKIEGGDGES